MRPSNPRLLLALVTKKKPWTKIGNTYSHRPLFGLAVAGGATVTPSDRIGNLLWRLARNHSFRPCPASNGRRLEDREIGVAPGQSVEADFAIPYSRKLAAQET